MANASCNWALIACVIGLWNSVSNATGSGDTYPTGSGDTYPCQLNQCSNPVIDFRVSCSEGSVEVQWSAPDDSLFGFCIQYQCSTDPSHCIVMPQRCETVLESMQTHTYTYSDLALPDQYAVCWFWVKDVSCDDSCCSVDSSCIINRDTITATISSITPTSVNMSNTRLTPILSMVSSNELSSSPTFQSVPVTTESISVSTTTPQLTNTIVTTTIAATTAVMNTMTTMATNTTTTATNAATYTTTTAIQLTTSTTHQPIPTVAPPTGETSPQNSFHPILIVAAFVFVTFLVVLLVTVMLLVYWRKQKQRKLEFKTIEKFCGDPSVHIPNDCKSVVESLPPDENDFVSILSVDPDDIYRELVNYEDSSQRRTSIITTLSDATDSELSNDGEEEVTSGYYSSNNGSGGHCCSQSSTTNNFNNTGAPSLNDDNNS